MNESPSDNKDSEDKSDSASTEPKKELDLEDTLSRLLRQKTDEEKEADRLAAEQAAKEADKSGGTED